MPADTIDVVDIAAIFHQTRRDFPFVEEARRTPTATESVLASGSWSASVVASQMAQYASIPGTLQRRSQFDQWVGAWKRDTRYTSSMTRIVLHPSYQAIIGMGKEALPLILEELRQHGGHWFWALHAITQEDPVPEGANYEIAAQAWLVWGLARRYIDELGT